MVSILPTMLYFQEHGLFMMVWTFISHFKIRYLVFLMNKPLWLTTAYWTQGTFLESLLVQGSQIQNSRFLVGKYHHLYHIITRRAVFPLLYLSTPYVIYLSIYLSAKYQILQCIHWFYTKKKSFANCNRILINVFKAVKKLNCFLSGMKYLKTVVYIFQKEAWNDRDSH